MGEIEFKGKLHTIGAGAALVLQVDRHMTAAQIEALVQHCHRALGADQRVLVLGPGVTPMTLDRLPVVSMDMASGPDQTVAGRVAPDGRIVIVNNVTSQIADPASAIARTMTAEFVHRSKKPRNGGASSCLKGEDPMEATRALVKKHGGGSGG